MTTDTYMTKLGTKFRFSFEEQIIDGFENYDIYILDQPDYGGRADDLHTTHRHADGDDRRICWTGPMPTLDEAMRIAGLWSDLTERYILTGQKFEE